MLSLRAIILQVAVYAVSVLFSLVNKEADFARVRQNIARQEVQTEIQGRWSPGDAM